MKLRTQLSLPCEVEDLVALGFQGLLEAKERFQASMGVAFKAFAYYRVRGAMLDGVRKMAPLSSRAHARLKAEVLQSQMLETSDTGAPENTGEAPVEKSINWLESTLTQLATAFLVSHYEVEYELGARTPEGAVIDKQAHTRLFEMIGSLPEAERKVISCFYIEGRTLEQLAKELGISKSWLSRLHHKALARLRQQLIAEDLG